MNRRNKASEFSARRGLILGFGGTIVLLTGVFGWSLFASVSGAVIASGVVGIEGRNKVVEHIDGGTVSEIFVREGDQVQKDQILMSFSDELLKIQETILLTQYFELLARGNRLEAEFLGEDRIIWDEYLIDMVQRNPEVQTIVDGQERLFRARIAARDGEINQIREQIGQAENEIKSLESRGQSLQQQNELITLELESEQKLFDSGLTVLSRLLALKRTAENLEGLIESNKAQIASIRGNISELEVQILLINLHRVEEAEIAAREVSANANEVREQLEAVTKQLDRLEVRAPVAGQIFEVSVFAPQEVILPGEPMLKIVPADAQLVVLAKVPTIDIDQVYIGQQAVLRFSAFPARETPEFFGHVKLISADVVQDELTGESYYEIELTLDQPVSENQIGLPAFSDTIVSNNATGVDQLKDSNTPNGGLTVTPGMPVEVHIRTIDRTVISYLIKPVSDFFYRSLREE
ncbi:MAG: HlyD family type I secretion periplasmic adaptor subunit [Paracoccaceae bacterium]|nr:HlyD family type I secretion periplasmic adaptor subunit [Paracoccaceae bacterium]MDE2916026.1 HlyD family type I secretion periplasmic adaptor subunit [Paracoccaceae bacterium]